jgi:hypothetical protein
MSEKCKHVVVAASGTANRQVYLIISGDNIFKSYAQHKDNLCRKL